MCTCTARRGRCMTHTCFRFKIHQGSTPGRFLLNRRGSGGNIIEPDRTGLSPTISRTKSGMTGSLLAASPNPVWQPGSNIRLVKSLGFIKAASNIIGSVLPGSVFVDRTENGPRYHRIGPSCHRQNRFAHDRNVTSGQSRSGSRAGSRPLKFSALTACFKCGEGGLPKRTIPRPPQLLADEPQPRAGAEDFG